MIPAEHAPRSLLGLKLFGSRRHSHVMADGFDLDFHTIPFHGEDALVEKHYVSNRSRRQKGILAFLAPDADQRVFCYANGQVRKQDQNDEILRFVASWKEKTGHLPTELIFDSRLISYANLSRLNQQGIEFMTLRRRSRKQLQAIYATPPSAWRRIELEGVERAYRTPRILDRRITLPGYEGCQRPLASSPGGTGRSICLVCASRKSLRQRVSHSRWIRRSRS